MLGSVPLYYGMAGVEVKILYVRPCGDGVYVKALVPRY